MAHAAINGVLKPFWDVQLRKPKSTLDQGEELRITTAQRNLLSARTAALVSASSCFDTQLPDIVTCVPLPHTPPPVARPFPASSL